MKDGKDRKLVTIEPTLDELKLFGRPMCATYHSLSRNKWFQVAVGAYQLPMECNRSDYYHFEVTHFHWLNETGFGFCCNSDGCNVMTKTITRNYVTHSILSFVSQKLTFEGNLETLALKRHSTK
ncbi:hypothetical protein WR25_12041 [Diploscapter pachys]|uniref:Uncharacterized protein n=1 Tax=Diploscapter pachys TaxID=2018661 RepID=A0A2A2LM62_9BILA|nr:hypothetical protein WR25_12041 [Diploscapter pachys]